jgi:hypothetical protein
VYWLILAAAAAVVFVLVRGRFWELGPCPWCTRKGRGKAGRSAGSGGQAWSRCRHCGGSGERVRPLALIWPRHRETARKRRQAIGRSRR